MKTFYSAADIEAMAAQGVRELAVDEDSVLTSVARELAGQLGIRLITPGQQQVGTPSAGASAGREASAQPRTGAATNPAKPRGCQHGPLSGGAPAAGSAVVDELIGAVKQYAQAGSPGTGR